MDQTRKFKACSLVLWSVETYRGSKRFKKKRPRPLATSYHRYLVNYFTSSFLSTGFYTHGFTRLCRCNIYILASSVCEDANIEHIYNSSATSQSDIQYTESLHDWVYGLYVTSWWERRIDHFKPMWVQTVILRGVSKPKVRQVPLQADAGGNSDFTRCFKTESEAKYIIRWCDTAYITVWAAMAGNNQS